MIRTLTYVGPKATEDAYFDRTGVIWTPGKSAAVLDEFTANEMLDYPNLWKETRDVVALTLDPSAGLLSGGAALTPSQAEQALAGFGANDKIGVLRHCSNAITFGQSIGIVAQGDSTGNATTEWVYLLAERLAQTFGNTAHIIYRLWNDATQLYDAPVIVQAGESGQRHAAFPVNSRSFSIPEGSFTAITGDIDIRVKCALDQYSRGATQTLVARYGTAGSRSFRMEINASNRFIFTWSADGTADIQLTAPAAPAFADGADAWFRATVDVDNGLGGRTGKLWTSTDGVAWTEIAASETTTGGATSIFNATGVEYEIGGRGQTGGVIRGKIYEVQIRSGIDGPIQNPQPIESWVPRGESGSYIPGYFSGTPTIYIWNGSKGGADYAYLSDATRFPKMVPPLTGGLYFQSCSHNDGLQVGAAYWALRDSWMTAVKARTPSACLIVLNQNPRRSPDPAHTITLHAKRCYDMSTWAAKNGYKLVNSYGAFLSDPRGWQTLLEDVDGVHPTQGLTGGSGVILSAVLGA